MDIELVNNVFNDVKNSKHIQDFIKELQRYLEDNNLNNENEEISLVNPIHNGNKVISKFRDKMLLERNDILNKYAEQTLDKGQMFYIYSKNSKMEEGYNLCICKEGESHNVIEESIENLPAEARIGSVLRKNGDSYILDEEATKKVSEQIHNMKDELMNEQLEFLKSKRIEGHIYELYENGGDRAWIFDITAGNDEEIEEIDFPMELLMDSKEGDLFVYKDGEYQKNI